jgi:hypothetical protein
MEMHNEEITDPYLPNAHINQKKSPAYKYKSPQRSGGTMITTIQANVDTSSQNIFDDAANEPSIAINPLNPAEIVIGWRQFDNILSNFRQAGWAYTSDFGQSWNFAGRIEQGIFRSDPVLEYDSSGNFYYNSLTYDTNISTFMCKVFRSFDGGASWDSGVDAAGGDKQWMAIDRTAGVGSGNIYSTWTAGSSICFPANFIRSTDGGNSYEPCTDVDGYPAHGTMAINSAGILYIAGFGNSYDTIIVTKSADAQIPGSVITWSAPVDIFPDRSSFGIATVNPVGLVGQVNIDVDPNNDNVYLLITSERYSTFDPGDVMFSKSTDGGQTWSIPVQINDDSSTSNTQWLGVMSVAPNGRIDAAWLDTRDAPGTDSSALYYSYSTDQGNTWSVNEKLSNLFDPHVGYPNQDKMGDYFDMISDNTGAHLAWANTLNAEQDVYYSFIVPPAPTDLETINEKIKLSVYPNPNNGEFVISTDAKSSRIEIYNAFGENIYSINSAKALNSVNINSQPAGIYIMRVMDEDGNTVIKELIKK